MPKSLFESAARDAILQRLGTLPSGATHRWGKMDVAQMLAHCSVAMEAGTGDRPRKQLFIGKILAPLVRSRVLARKNSRGARRPIRRSSSAAQRTSCGKRTTWSL